MTDKRTGLNISRRKVLAGLGTIGVASAGAGLGTSAFLNDTESFTGNSITAGTLDMTVTASVEAVDDYWDGQIDVASLEETAQGEAAAGLVAEDVKPGDWAIICFDIDIGENPGYVQIRAENLVSDENGYEEPENEDDNGEGELEEAILATLWSSFDGTDREGLEGLDATTNNGGSSQSGHSWDPTRAEGGEVSSDPVIHYTTFQEAYGTYNSPDGVVIGGRDNPTEIGSEEADEFQFCLLLEIPTEVGNEIQGDSLSFDLVFNAEQSRHNDDPFNSSA